MTLAEAITLLRTFARHAGSSAVYSDADCQKALEGAFQYFCRETQYLVTSGTVTVAAGSDAVDASALTAFHPSRIISVLCEGVEKPLKRIGPEAMHGRRVIGSSGDPDSVSFYSDTAGYVHPKPSSKKDLTVRYWKPWVTPASGSLLLPAEILQEIIPTGAAAFLQHNDPEQLYASGAWAKFLTIVEQYKGVNNMGSNLIQMPSMDD